MKVFISHSTRDFQIVTILKKYLESKGIQAYIAEHDFNPGQPLSQKIIKNLNNSDYFLVVYTYNGKESDFVNQEIGYWMKQRGYNNFIPLVEKGITPEGFLAGIEFIQYDPHNPYIGLNDAIGYFYQQKSDEDDKNKWLIGAGILTGIGIVALIIAGLTSKDN